MSVPFLTTCLKSNETRAQPGNIHLRGNNRNFDIMREVSDGLGAVVQSMIKLLTDLAPNFDFSVIFYTCSF